MLSRYNVSAMITEYDGPQVSGVSFKIMVEGKPMSFKLPCNWRAVKEIFDQDPKLMNTKYNTGEQAIRTGWRIIAVWVKAQLALAEIDMVTVPQVFLPYAIMKGGRTLSEHIAADPGFLLGAGNE